ncbi:MAG: serine/threonine-protein kinase [Sandaracinaceae bacterium]
MAPPRRASLSREPDVLVDGEAWSLGSTLTGDESKAGSLPPPPLMPLAFSDRYEMLGVLASGAMSEIRLCRDRPFAREVAMKVLRAHRPSSRWRFLREARVQGQLSHPAIVPVYDFGHDAVGEPYFTMKWVRGVRFDLALAEQREAHVEEAMEVSFTERQLLMRLHQICMAMHYAHGRGVVHRDLKPTNLMLGEFGEVYVLDWGLAKVRTEKDAPYEPIDDASGALRTTDGSVLGTIGYMAPEQLQGEVDIDARADVYSLGSMLYELLARKTLHSGSAATQALSSLKTDGARPSERADREIAKALDDACFAALRVSPGARMSSARELAEAIESAL